MELALFDLDNTLLNGDSDFAWSEFMIEVGELDRTVFEAKNLVFYEQYKAGTLDIFEFLAFQLKPLARHSHEVLNAWHAQFMREKIRPMIGQKALDLVARHQRAGDICLIITATNRFVTAPIAAAFGVTHLIATEPEEIAGRFTGKVRGVPSFREGKITRLESWMAERGWTWADFSHSTFYSDSLNDLPLLNKVHTPVAVDADPTLRAHAIEQGWSQLSLR